MPLPRRSDQGFVASTLAIGVLSMLLGGGAAILAVEALVNSAGPNDQIAVQNGPSGPVDPAKILVYGSGG
ncbi:MAG TPA: hypothetical protein VF391_04285 [Dermatophilaceae bacterium]